MRSLAPERIEAAAPPKTLRNGKGTVIQAANFPFWWL
jgi:hypothetical protein